MQHPYLVVQRPNARILLYECEQGDLDEGVRVEGLRAAPKNSYSNSGLEHAEEEEEEETKAVRWLGPVAAAAEGGSAGERKMNEVESKVNEGEADTGQTCKVMNQTWKVMNMTLQTELLQAAEDGDYDGLKRALAGGANLDTGCDTPYTVSALHLAARGNPSQKYSLSLV
jgi:hypothetical protein